MSNALEERPRVLYIDDEKPNLIGFKYMFRSFYEILLAESTEEADSLLAEHAVDVIIADQRMSKETGVDFFQRILPRYPDAIRMLLTGYSDIEAVIDAINRGKIFYYFRKPWKEEEVRLVIAKALEASRMKRLLTESERRFRDISHSMADWIWETDADGRCAYVSGRVAEVLGRSPGEMVGQSLFELIAPADAERVRQRFAGAAADGRPFMDLAFDFIAGDRLAPHLTSGIPIRDDAGGAIGFRGVSKDMTEAEAARAENRRLENLLRQAQKMEAIGRLAGGIAHDFNNILSPILGYAEIAMDEAGENEGLRDCVRQIHIAGRRARDLVRQILTFSRKEEQAARPILVGPILKEALRFLRASFPTTIRMNMHIDEAAGRVMADPTQIYQVIVNLCVNARHAMGEAGGTLSVFLSEVVLTADDHLQFDDIPPGPYLKMTVSDTGAGMTPMVIARIFEPYFTTRKVGEGSGLGLSVVHGIIKRFNGAVKVYSEPGVGATFNLYLPVIGRDASERRAAPPAPAPTGTERVLMVDDDENALGIERLLMERLGYAVTPFADSLAALERFRAGPDDFDLVLSDMTMPGLTGVDLTREVVALRPHMPVLICTGFSDPAGEERARRAGARGVIRKPLAKRELALAARAALAGVAPEGTPEGTSEETSEGTPERTPERTP